MRFKIQIECYLTTAKSLFNDKNMGQRAFCKELQLSAEIDGERKFS